MTTRQLAVKHVFDGGWAPDLGPYSPASPDQAGILRISHLVNAENIVYEADGGPHKMPGTARINSTQMESGAVVMGAYDFWLQGTGGSPAQHRIVHVGTTVKKDDADGTFTNLFTGLESGAIPSYSTFDDILIISSTSTADVPKSWDGSTAQNLAGSPPNFAFSATHKNRSWAAGVVTNPSTLYFSNSVDPEDWSGGGSIQIDPNDGDMITGIISHKDDLFVFKGPYKGSIHRITGSSPTGSDAFARIPFIKGLGAVWHNSIFRYADDVAFLWSDGSVRSLAATAAYGDYNEVTLSRPIQQWIRSKVNFSRLKFAWATNVPAEGFALITLAIDGSTNNNAVLMMDYRFQPVRWAYWSLSVGCLAEMNDPAQSDRPIVMGGSNDGYLLRLLRPDRNINGSAIAYKVTTPFFDYGSTFNMKTLANLALGVAPKNDGNITFTWRRDNETAQTASISQDGGSATLGSFELDTDTLGGATFVNQFYDATGGGEFHSVQYELTNSVLNEDVEVHSIAAIIEVGPVSLEAV